MCKNSKIIMLGKDHDKSLAYLSRPDCRVWGCEECAKAMAYDHRRRIAEGIRKIGGKWHFLTMTAHSNCRTSESSLVNLKSGFTKLIERFRRAHGTQHYVLVHEFHARIADNGTRAYHMHMLYNCDLPLWDSEYPKARKKKKKVRRLKDLCAECGMGYMVDVQPVTDNDIAVAYVAKYIGKAMQESLFPKRFKRVRYSEGFPSVDENFENDMDWSVIENDRLSVRAVRSDLIDNNWSVKSNFRIEELSSIYDELLDLD